MSHGLNLLADSGAQLSEVICDLYLQILSSVIHHLLLVLCWLPCASCPEMLVHNAIEAADLVINKA